MTPLTDRQRQRRIDELMSSTNHYALEDEALELAYGIVNANLRAYALKSIADAMMLPETAE